MSVVNFEKAQLALTLIYDKDGKVQGINMVPAQAIRR